jgi:hypothetical protein
MHGTPVKITVQYILDTRGGSQNITKKKQQQTLPEFELSLI